MTPLRADLWFLFQQLKIGFIAVCLRSTNKGVPILMALEQEILILLHVFLSSEQTKQ